MVLATAAAHRHLVAGTQIWSSLAGVQYLGIRAGEFIHELACQRRDARHASQKIQRGAFGGEYCSRLAMDLSGGIASIESWSITVTRAKAKLSVQQWSESQ